MERLARARVQSRSDVVRMQCRIPAAVRRPIVDERAIPVKETNFGLT